MLWPGSPVSAVRTQINLRGCRNREWYQGNAKNASNSLGCSYLGPHVDRDILKDWNTHTHILLWRTSKHQGQNLTAVAEYVLECCGGRTEISHGTVRNTHVWVSISLGLRDPKWSIRVIHWSSASRCSGKIDYKHKQICSGTIMDIDEWTSDSSLWNMKVLRTLNLLWFSDIWMDYLQKTDFFSLRVWSRHSS